MGRKSQKNPTFTKATYDNKRRRFDPPDPARKEAEILDKKLDAEKKREFHKLRNKDLGAAVAALFPDRLLKPKEPIQPIKRRI